MSNMETGASCGSINILAQIAEETIRESVDFEEKYGSGGKK